MTRMKRLSGKKVVRVLEKMGFHQARQRGSHVVMKKITSRGALGCVVPMHKELATGTLYGLLKHARIPPDDFPAQV